MARDRKFEAWLSTLPRIPYAQSEHKKDYQRKYKDDRKLVSSALKNNRIVVLRILETHIMQQVMQTKEYKEAVNWYHEKGYYKNPYTKGTINYRCWHCGYEFTRANDNKRRPYTIVGG